MKSLFIKYSKHLQSKIEKSCFTSLDEIPVFNWWKVNAGEYSYLFKETKEVEEKELGTVLSIYRSLLSEYIKLIGIPDTYKDVLRKQKRIASLKLKYVIKRDRKILTQIKIAEEELKAMVMNEGESNFNEVKAYLERFLGFRIDPKTTSVIEFDGYVKLMQKQSN